MSAADGDRVGQGATPPRAGARRALLAFNIVWVRLRFLLLLVVASLVVGQWDVLRNYWDRLTRADHAEHAHPVAGDTEYFCPMCPGVVSQWPTKCPVCNMALVRRPKGEMTPFPSGVVKRMQLAPYRVQLAGVETSDVHYEPLRRRVELAGAISAEPRRAGTVRVPCEVTEADLPYLRDGAMVEATCDALPGHRPFRGRLQLRGPSSAVIEIEDPTNELQPGLFVTARADVPMADQEPFAQLPVEAWRDRLLGVAASPMRAGPTSWLEAMLRSAAEVCAQRQGLVLAVPESAVIDTGTRRIVYLESAPGVFDGLEVTLGQRAGESYPVLRGLESGQRVVTRGAFLIDAETSLNRNLSVSYFGAAAPAVGPIPAASAPADAAVASALAALSPADRELARRQQTCPVTGKPLGSMGTPTRVELNGRVAFLCCEGCEAALRRQPEKYLPKPNAPAAAPPVRP